MPVGIIILTILGYIGALFVISYITSRKSSNAGFFVGGRQSNVVVVTIAMVCAAMSGVTFISVPGMVATSGFSYMQMALGFVVGQLIIAFVLIPLFYRMNLLSIYEYLENRFGVCSHKTGAWFFFISKLLGAAVRLFLICSILQLLIFDVYGIPFYVNALIMVLLIYAYTFKGGVKSVIWIDILKTVCIIGSIVLCIYVAAKEMGMGFMDILRDVRDNEMSRTFFFDDVNSKHYFFKQFFAGVFALIAMTGLDQDMMQRNLSCKNFKDSQKNIIISSILQTIIILMFLVLGVILYQFASKAGIALPKGTDHMFPTIATSPKVPIAVGIVFVLGLISSTFATAGSALTALTTSFTVDILARTKTGDESQVARTRKITHTIMAVVMLFTVCVFYKVHSTNVIDAVYTLASYSYGPILGMFAFGIMTKWNVRDKWVGVVAVAAPLFCFILQQHSEEWMGGYKFSYELLIVNAALTFLGMVLLIRKKREL